MAHRTQLPASRPSSSTRQLVLRSAMTWGVALLMILLAAGVSAYVGGAGQATLAEEAVASGPLSARVPAGWQVRSDAYEGAHMIVAEDRSGETRVRLVIALEPAGAGGDPIRWALVKLGGELLDEPRPVEVAGRAGLMHTLLVARPLGQTGLDRMRLGRAVTTVAAARLSWRGEAYGVRVLVDRFGDYSPADAALVRRVAATVRVEE